MTRLIWLVGPPAAGKSTGAAALGGLAHPPRVVELAWMLHPLVHPTRRRKGMGRAKGLLIQAIRTVELEPENHGLPPLVVISAIQDEADLFPLAPEEEVLLLLPPREQWERQFLGRSSGPAPGGQPMGLTRATEWYERYLGWLEGGLPVTRVTSSEQVPDFIRRSIEAPEGRAQMGAPAVSRHSVAPLPGARELLEALLAFDTSPEGTDHLACAMWLRARLESLGFTCRLHQPGAGAPALIEAHRPARGLEGHVVMYGHYDVTSLQEHARGRDGTSTTLVEEGGRWFAHGVSDNKGPLATRLAALMGIQHTPALTWFIQGEEETGSAVASGVLGEKLPGLAANLWLEETGYHDYEDGTLRLIACRPGGEGASDMPPDAAMHELLDALHLLARRWGIESRREVRRLNKAAVKGGCPFHRNLPRGARYLALGINDSRSNAHGADESVPVWTSRLHAEQLQCVFHWVDRVARRDS